MNDIARQLRAQIPSSTDPDRLEQMARAAEGRTSPLRTQCVDSREAESECPEYPELVKLDAPRLRPSCAAECEGGTPRERGEAATRIFRGLATIVRTLDPLPRV
jgi:hypothetical protein